MMYSGFTTSPTRVNLTSIAHRNGRLTLELKNDEDVSDRRGCER